MTPEERAGFAAAINEAITLGCAEVRQHFEQRLTAIQSDAIEIQRTLVQRCERAEARADQLARDLDAVRELASADPITAMLVDAAGDLMIVQRSGATTKATLVQLVERIAAQVGSGIESLREGLTADATAQVAREVLRMGGAERWDRAAFYGEGAVVSCYGGRTYELAPGVRSSMAQEPGDHPKVWKRIGSHGLRVLKSKPAIIEPLDLFTDAESKFLSDGETTALLVARAPKPSEVKAAAVTAQSALEIATQAKRLAEGHAPLIQTVQRTAASNQAWIEQEGEPTVQRSTISAEWIEQRAEDIDAILDPEPTRAKGSA
jgi:hypothetical protein